MKHLYTTVLFRYTTFATLSKFKRWCMFVLLTFLVSHFFDLHEAQAQSQTVLLNATGTFTVPAGVTSLKVECWGGGGGGGFSAQDGRGCGGGGGGAFAKSNLTVTPGQTFSYSVGTGGSGGTEASNNKNGGDTWFGSTTTVLAKGGLGVANNSSTGAPGGQASQSIGNVVTRSGGNGGNGTGAGSCHAAGGGGGGAGTDNPGGNGANGQLGSGLCLGGGTGGAGGIGGSQFGGNGGNGTSSEGGGGAGNVYGAGGGGGKKAAVCIFCSNQPGGGGAPGLIRVVYCVPPVISAGPDVSIGCSGSTTLNATVNVPSGNQNIYTASTFADFANFITNDANRWAISATNFAGGTPDELNFQWFSGSDPTNISSWASSPVIDASNATTLNLSFKHFVDYFTSSFTLRLQTSTDQTTWNTVWSITPSSDVGPATVNVNLNTLAGQFFYFRFLFEDNVWNIDNWYIDDIVISGNISIPVTYQWSPITGLSNPNIANPVASPSATTTYTLTVLAGGCSATDEVTVTVSGGGTPTITCPSNIAASTSGGACGATVSYITPVGQDACGTPTTNQTAGLASGSVFPVGTTTNTFTVTSGSQSANCSFTVTVNDTQAPTINCPNSITVNTSGNDCFAAVTYATPVGTDNCPGASTQQTAGLASGANFPIGTTANSFAVTAANGQTANCTFTVTVNSATTPTLTCPNNLTVNNDTGICGAVVTYITPTSGDNCAGGGGTPATQLLGLPSGATFPLGTTTNVFSVTGPGGQQICTFDVLVVYNESPTITCPANITVNNSPGICGAQVTFVPPSGSDSCTGSTTTQTSGLPSGFTFPLGTTTNTFTVTAATGLSASCSFTITVNNTAGLNASVTPMPPTAMGPVFYNVATVNYTNGVAPINFNWVTNGYVQHTQTAPGQITVVYAANATWSVTITDNSFCGTGIVLSNPPAAGSAGLLNIVSSNITSDSGSFNGAITITAAGGNPCGGTPYSYTWAGPANWIPSGNVNSPTITNLPAGWYIVTVTDCGPDGVISTGDEQQVFGWYWVPKQHRGRTKTLDLALQANTMHIYPNPTSGQTAISFSLPDVGFAVVTVYDLNGKLVSTLFEGFVNAETPQMLTFNPDALPGGMYFCRLSVPEWGEQVQKRLFIAK